MSSFKFYYLFALLLPALIDSRQSRDDIRTYLYVRQLEPIVIKNTTEESPAMKNFVLYFNPERPTKIIIHGWRAHLNKTTILELVKAYRDTTDYNVIGIDWRAMTYKVYTTTLTYLDDVGEYVADLINFLIENLHTNPDRIHIVGHSLGAHAAGLAGTRIFSKKIARITGLDPASPGIKPVHWLQQSDAQFVDVIHTAAGFIGILDNIGHADFYPNKGQSTQPGCVLVNCSHRRAVIFFTESIYNPNSTFLAYKCDSWKRFKTGDCHNTEPVQMGENTDVKALGKYYLRTSKEPPYSLTRFID